MRRKLLPLLVGFGLTIAAQAAADDTAELEGLLDTSVVSAPSKTAETVSVAPATSLVLTAEDLRRYGIRSLDEAINFLAFGMVTEKSFQTAEVGARGVNLTSDFGSHVLLMVDGHVLNEQWSSTAYFDRGTAIPLELIDHIELVLGPGSVLYGSNAMLGIVHIVTKRAKDFRGLHLGIESEVPTSLRGFAGVGKEFELFGTRGELVFGVEDYRQRGPVFDYGPVDLGPDDVTGESRRFDLNPDGPRYPPGVWGGRGNDAYASHEPAAYLRVRLGAFELGARAASWRRSTPTDTGNFDDPASYQLDRFTHVDLRHSLAASSVVELTTRLYADAYAYDQYWTSNGADDCLSGQTHGCLWRLHGEAAWAGLEPQLSLNWFKNGRAVTLVGLDGRISKIHSGVDFIDNATGVNPRPLRYSPTQRALAAYLQQTAWLTRGIALNAGVRLDVDDRFGSHASPRAAASFFPWAGGTFKVMVAEAFRAPTSFDIYYHDPATQLAGGSHLRPETVRSLESSLEHRFGAQRILTSVFYSFWDDLLLLQDLSDSELSAAIARGDLEPQLDAASQLKNVAAIRSFGYDVAYEGSLVAGRLRYAASVTEAFSYREDPAPPGASSAVQRDLLPLAPRVFGNARVSYDLANGLPTLALAARFIGRRPTSFYPDDGFAKPATEWRVTASGPLLQGLSYRVTANFLSVSHGAYTLLGGPLLGGSGQRNPNDQLRVGVGLGYDLPF